MEAYPEDYLNHNVPLIVLSGLGPEPESPSGTRDQSRAFLREGGFRIQCSSASVTGRTADTLLGAFQAFDTDTWANRNNNPKVLNGNFRIKRSGRTYTLPPRKAPPPPQSPFTAPLGIGDSFPAPLALHSTISPLTPSSPVYPDGMITALWITKHQSRLPAVFITSFNLTSDPNTSALRDNQLKNEINGIRAVFGSTNYKTKLVVILLCEEGEDTPYDLDDRLSIIRRGTGLDPKTSFFLPPESSKNQVEDFAKMVLVAIQPSCVEYYRDLSKHTRRKRNRGTPPPPTIPPTSGTSQTLSQQGWNVRYEFKLGVLAEFRQEMDAACRNYESAYEGLFAPELFEAIPSWSPRFNEARMLADALAVRIIRCLLWSAQTTTAVRSWEAHRDRIEDLVIRRGNGTENYGWEAWEALWFKTMAQLIDRAGLLALSLTDKAEPQVKTVGSIFCLSEKTIPIGERTAPWELLHHQGYWLDQSQKHTQRRRRLARLMPEEDRSPPGESPASVIASKAHLYDTYLTPAPHAEYPTGDVPGFDHTSEIINTIRAATAEFSSRKQVRIIERLCLDMAHSFMQEGHWEAAFNVLMPVWRSLSWRRAGWWHLVSEVGWSLHDCALHCQDQETLLRVLWELHSSQFVPRPNFTYDFSKALASYERDTSKPALVVRAEDVVSPLNTSFAFIATDGNVGETLDAQLIVRSTAQLESAPLRVTEIKVVFEGGLRPVRLLSDEDSEAIQKPGVSIQIVQLRDSSLSLDASSLHSPAGGLVSLIGTTNLAFAPRQTKVFELSMIPREAGDVRVASITLLVDEDSFSIAHVSNGHSAGTTKHWYLKGDRVMSRRIGYSHDTTLAKILPKPPKLDISMPNLREIYYTNEKVQLSLQLRNDEDGEVDLTIDLTVRSPVESPLTIAWEDSEGVTFQAPVDQSSISTLSLPAQSVGLLDRGGSKTLIFNLTNTDSALQYEISVIANYHLVSDMETPMSKEITVSVPFVRPFEANYDFLPRLDPMPWPNFFEMPDDAILMQNYDAPSSRPVRPEGLTQRFILVSKVVSFASEQLIIEGVDLLVEDITGGAICHVSESHGQLDESQANVERDQGREISPEELQESTFDLDVTKIALADRRTVGIDFALAIRWRRQINSTDTSSSDTTSTLATPRFAVPMSEPRVLLTAAPSGKNQVDAAPGLATLLYTIENPSLHFLTFSLTMESSEDFAFSGPKSSTVSLVPMSRQSVAFRILATKRDVNSRNPQGVWLRPSLLVVDQGFRKTLKVVAAGEGIKQDKKGPLVWVD